ncbi:MAG: hypothetical protein M0Z25_06295, partial [Nitrospiraceae bacterium]|nr:hypothetical protein [Nitrospiraceae bacterium]
SEEEMAEVLAHKVGTIDRRACRARAAQLYSTEVMVDGYEALYRSILRDTRRGGPPPLRTSLQNTLTEVR